MKPRLIFSTNNIIGSILVRFGTRSHFSHVDYILPDGVSIIGARAFKGVVQETLEERIARSTHYAIYEFDGDAQAIAEQLRPQLGKRYDWLGCMGIAAHRDWRQDDAWFCSELVEYAAERAGSPLLNHELKLNRISPELLLHSPLLRRVG
jgi:hypothetical protein